MNTKIFKSAVITSFISSCMLMGCNSNRTNDETNSANQMNALNLTSEWDKTFPKSDKVNHSKITFHNRYGITLAADLYTPVNASGKLPAIAVSGPFGAVKEQSSGLYAQQLAERGFLIIRFIKPLTKVCFLSLFPYLSFLKKQISFYQRKKRGNDDRHQEKQPLLIATSRRATCFHLWKAATFRPTFLRLSAESVPG